MHSYIITDSDVLGGYDCPYKSAIANSSVYFDTAIPISSFNTQGGYNFCY